MKHGLFEDIPDLEYRNYPAISQSDLKAIGQNAHKWHLRVRKEETPSMRYGRLVHTALFLPEVWENNFQVFEGDRRTKTGKEEYEILLETCKPEYILKADEYYSVRACKLEIESHPEFKKLQKAKWINEVSIFWQQDDIELKSRLDSFSLEIGTILDLKLTNNASKWFFKNTIVKFGYHIQAAFYLDSLASCGINADTFVFITVENSEPFAIGIYQLHRDAIEYGRKEYQRLLNLYKEYSAENFWPDYTTGIELIDLPAYLYARKENEMDLSDIFGD